jgi:hypothetical protein
VSEVGIPATDCQHELELILIRHLDPGSQLRSHIKFYQGIQHWSNKEFEFAPIVDAEVSTSIIIRQSMMAFD